MKVDLFTATGTKKGSLELPASMFEVEVNKGLMHLALVRQQSNRRNPIAHARHRGEMVGSTRKLYQQKHTGQARRGASRSPLLKGGGKSFGPRNEANFVKDMPRKICPRIGTPVDLEKRMKNECNRQGREYCK
jgi:large subunit ribosomal protein L4